MSCDARVMASEPKRSRNVVDGAVERRHTAALKRQRQLNRAVVVEVRQREPDERDAALLDHRHRRDEQLAAHDQDRARLDGRLEQRVRARGAREVVEAEPQRDRAACAARLAQPQRQPVDDGDQHLVERAMALRRAPAKRVLRPHRAAPAARADAARVIVVRERVEVAAGRAAEHLDQLHLGQLGHLSDGGDPALVQLARGDRPNAPEPLDRQRVQEVELSPGGTTSSPSGFATALATLARNFVQATPTVTGSPTCSRTRRRSLFAISVGVPAKRSSPRTSRKASSIDSFSTSGEVSSNTSSIALLASTYADKRGWTTIALGHRRRARCPPMALRTPKAWPRSSPRGRPRHRR